MTGLAITFAAIALGSGIALQRLHPDPQLTRLLWVFGYWLVTPIAVFVGFTLIPWSGSLGAAMVGAILASYVSVVSSLVYARKVGRSRAEIGALALTAGFGNTAALGYAFAGLLFGREGLTFMVVYSQFAWLVPQSAVTTAIARSFASAWAWRTLWRAVVINPPLLVGVATLAARAQTDLTVAPAESLASVVLAIAAPYGFFMLGATIPLTSAKHDDGDLVRAAGVLALRFSCGPATLFAYSIVSGTAVPGPFYLGAAMPCAFHLVTLARVFELRPQLVRLLVVGSTVAATAVVIVLTAFSDGAPS